jgi:hypothetical protein
MSPADANPNYRRREINSHLDLYDKDPFVLLDAIQVYKCTLYSALLPAPALPLVQLADRWLMMPDDDTTRPLKKSLKPISEEPVSIHEDELVVRAIDIAAVF